MLTINNLVPCKACLDTIELGDVVCCCDCDECIAGKLGGNWLCHYCKGVSEYGEATAFDIAMQRLGREVQHG